MSAKMATNVTVLYNDLKLLTIKLHTSQLYTSFTHKLLYKRIL